MTIQSNNPNDGLRNVKPINEEYPIDLVFNNLGKHKEAHDNRATNISTQERPKFVRWFGKALIILTLISFIFVGLILNALQLVLCLTIRLSNNRQWRRLHKLANGYLIYMIYTQPIFLIYFWPRVDMKIHLADQQMIADVKKDLLGIIIANHTYELDWMMCFFLADQIGNIGSYKCFAKDELKWLPVIGWSFWMSDLIYVKRDWNRDKIDIEKKLDELLIYDQILLGIFAEGTRMTREKYYEAVEFARSRNMEPLKYHLFPRARGFNFTLRHYLRATNLEKPIRVFNLEIVLPDRPNFKHFLEGSYIKADIYCEEVAITDEIREEARISKDSEDCPKLTRFLQDIYRRKDEIIEGYQRESGFHPHNDRFTKRALFPIRKPYAIGFYWLILMSSTYGTIAYLAVTLFAKSIAFWTLIATLLTSGMLMLRQIEKESKPNNLRMLKRNKMACQICDPKAA